MRKIDATDLRILHYLSTSSRSSAVAIAEALSLSRNTVQSRLAALQENGTFLDFGRRVSPAAIGSGLTAFISVHVQQHKLSSVTAAIATIPEVLQAYGLTGQTDILVQAVSTTAEDLFRIDGQILGIDGVERTDTALAMQELIPYRVTPLLRQRLAMVTQQAKQV